MSTPLRLVGFLAAALAVFAAAAGVGKAVGPVDTETEEHGHSGETAQGGDADGHGSHGGGETDALPGGLSVSAAGHTLELATDAAEAGRDREVAFTVTGPDGEPVTDYDVVHEKQLHLIAVRRDLTGFQHLHPTLDDDGVWRTGVDLTPGAWRIFTDFSAHGTPLTLGADLQVAGDYEPAEPVAESRTAEVDDYQVRLTGDLTPGQDGELRLTVTKDGEPVTDLQPYLGAYGHLVALRAGDLAYLHVHPDGEPGDGSTPAGPEVVFHATAPSAGRYHLYLDFRHDGVVRTAAFTLTTGGSRQARPTESATPDAGEEQHSDSHQH